VIGEDSVLFREGLARLLADAGHDIVRTASTAPQAITAVRDTLPDLTILDLRMPPDLTDDGARAASALRDEFPLMGILMLSQHVETRHSLNLVSRGRFGYLLKDRVLDINDFLDTLERIRAGGSALDSEVVARLLGAKRLDSRLERLTPREADVLALMAEGRTNAGIADRLWLTERTVETHVSSILAKLELGATGHDHRRVLAVIAFLEHRTVPLQRGSESERPVDTRGIT
jgi:serine/threonine-protein kinase PknK